MAKYYVVTDDLRVLSNDELNLEPEISKNKRKWYKSECEANDDAIKEAKRRLDAARVACRRAELTYAEVMRR